MTQLSSKRPNERDPEPCLFVVVTDAGLTTSRSSEKPLDRGKYSPRSRYQGPLTNPTNLVLAHLRDFCKHWGVKVTASHVRQYLEVYSIENFDVPQSHIDHAREVLTRVLASAPVES